MQRERKVVTVLFADLVGFTSRAEALDPEDVHAILRPYHERLRSELERHGGTFPIEADPATVGDQLPARNLFDRDTVAHPHPQRD